MKRSRTSMLGLIAAASITLASMNAWADWQNSIPATAGHTVVSSETTCMNFQDFSNQVSNTGCGGTVRWVVPLTLHWLSVGSPVSQSVRATAVGAGTGPTCRLAVRSSSDGSMLLGSLVTVGSDTFLGGRTMSTTTGDNALVQCDMAQGGKSLASIRWFGTGSN